jgi:hypothetical protein
VWLTNPNEEPYDLPAVTAGVDAGTVELTLSTVADLAAELTARGPWSVSHVYAAGTPTGVAATLTALAYAGFPAACVRTDQIGPDDEPPAT